jgi:predicted naringenin-chalcone synthase
MAAYINTIGAAVPPYDVHKKFIEFAGARLATERHRQLFFRMADRAEIEHRYSFLPVTEATVVDDFDFYRPGQFPDITTRMNFFEGCALDLAAKALDAAALASITDQVTHVIIVTCTGFYCPGLDIEIIRRFGLARTVERTTVGFMGCCAAINGLKIAGHIVNSNPTAKVLMINLELCTLHFQDTTDLERMLLFMLWGDGCAACVVSAEPYGIEMNSFTSLVLPDTTDQMSWRIGTIGFEMQLSGAVPHTLARELPKNIDRILGGHNREDVALWAIHPGGRSILDAIANAIPVDASALCYSRDVLRRFGNMSSATFMFILKSMLDDRRAGLGCGMAFGPGLVAESMLFPMVGPP